MELYENLTAILKMKENAKDYLKIFVNLTIGLLKLRLAKHALMLSFTMYTFSTILGLNTFVRTLDHRYLIEFGPLWGLQMYMLINLGSILKGLETMKKFFTWHENMRIPYEIMNEKLTRKVEKVSKLAKFTVLMNYGVASIACVVLTSKPEYLFRKSHVRVWACTTLPGPCWMKSSIISGLDSLTGFAMVSSPTAMIYFGITGIFRLMLINEFVQTICSSKIPHEERYDSELYQKLVGQKLKICVMLHDQAVRDSIYGGSLIYFHIILFTLGAIIMGGSLMLLILSAYDEGEYVAFIGMSFYGICSMITAALYITIGQGLKDESERLWYILIQLPWYYMNNKNVKIYSVLLRKSQKLISLTTDLIEVDYLLFLRIIRALYSLAAFVLRMGPSD